MQSKHLKKWSCLWTLFLNSVVAYLVSPVHFIKGSCRPVGFEGRRPSLWEVLGVKGDKEDKDPADDQADVLQDEDGSHVTSALLLLPGLFVHLRQLSNRNHICTICIGTIPHSIRLLVCISVR